MLLTNVMLVIMLVMNAMMVIMLVMNATLLIMLLVNATLVIMLAMNAMLVIMLLVNAMLVTMLAMNAMRVMNAVVVMVTLMFVCRDPGAVPDVRQEPRQHHLCQRAGQGVEVPGDERDRPGGPDHHEGTGQERSVAIVVAVDRSYI